ncbi:MAG: 30S ribosomal protein S8 [Candidatus Handelsmanbacteria bacterium RIFCSPLOWO2_12_FULL_64_10]|uniref:Small ribosomal subunit protein uS8 n=1 Tax=Handelsmanbacteria sp. (strain RIFCSPLOWO2_12_FULL_64_10) TaxID=1817868 RepID=A0A1F6C9Y4_HANXR|nr:ribosomal protein S8 [uncultured bacterium]OGG45946.1 MAG: 30S ribosomal protein S8 [Candidatus Handelsmanbacteria bacterium RIFCSPLOWO2_12_FULL_64_10]
MLSMIKNANMRGYERVVVDHSKLKERVAAVLKEEGYLKAVQVVEEDRRGTKRRFIHVYLKYGEGGEKVISGIKRVSKPGCRVYKTVGRIPKVLDDLGTSILTTSRGVMSHRAARKQKVGGELLCQVW